MELKRTVLNAVRCTWVIFLTLLLGLETEGAKKCSRTLSRVPVHKDFNIDKFLGTWYTVTRTTWAWGENTYHSFSIEVKKEKDDTFHFSYTGSLGDKCLPVVSGVLTEKGRPGSYLIKMGTTDNNPASMIISFTDYRDLALVYYCFKYHPGTRAQCQQDGMQVEVIARQENPPRKDVVAYIKRAGQRLCASVKDLQATKPGQCKIPDILKAAKQREKDQKKGGGKPGDKCALNNIPVKKNFDLAQLQGLWYEIARTRFTFNKLESVVNYQRHDKASNNMYSYYTGTLVTPDGDGSPTCMTAIQGMSKTADGATEVSDRLGRIGWEDSTATPWSPTKVVYADDDYVLFYACYAPPGDTKCLQQAMEVTLTGRTREISSKKRDEIYSILPSICVNSADMVETKFLENCTSWVIVDSEKVDPSDCILEDIKVYEDFDNTMMTGTWYLYASITFNNMTSLRGVVAKKSLAGATEIIDSFVIGYIEGDESATCHEYRTKTRDMCVDTGYHVKTLPIGDGNFVFSKVLHLDDFMLVEYTCLSRSGDGTCDKDGIQFHVYTKNATSEETVLSDDQAEKIRELAGAVCLDSTKLQLESEWCNMTDFQEPRNFGVDAECDVDTITIFSDMDEYVQDGIYGYWYEVSRSQDVDGIRSTMAFFTSANNNTLIFTYTGPSADGDDCEDVKQETLLARCHTDSSGDFLRRFNETEDFVSYVPFKIIYTDYNQVLVTYSCRVMLISGQCAENGAQLRIWSRNHTLDEDTREYAYEMAFWACLNPFQEGFLKNTEVDNDTCRQKLEDYVTENGLDQLDSDTSDEDDNNDDGDIATQRDQQGKDKYALSDIDALLQMDDDEFYSDD